MTIFKNHFIFCSSLVFFFYLFFFQYPFFNYELGVLTSYVNNFNALNEISFWSGFFGDSFILSSSFNPLKLNLIVWLLFSLSFVFSQSLVFSFAPLIFTTLSFFFALKIFEIYKLQKSWSVLLAFFGMTSISSMPLFDTLINLVTFSLFNPPPHGVYFDLLTSFSSSLVLAAFLGLLFLTLKTQLLKSNSKNLLPTFWALSVFVHPALFIFGYTFIFLINLIELRREKLNQKPLKIGSFILVNFLPLLFAIPYIIYNIDFFGSSPTQIVLIEQNELLNFFKAIFLYLILPFGLMLLGNQLYRVDPYESLVRFWPILLIALIEMLLRTFYLFNLLPINDEVILNRVAVYFLHFFYYLPFLSVVTREFTYLPDLHYQENDSLNKLRKIFNYLFINLSSPIVLLMVVTVSLATYTSIDHEPYRMIDNRAKLLKTDLKDIFLDQSLGDKKIQFLSMDEKIISSFLFPNKIASNIFIEQGSSSQSKELDFLQGIYQRDNNELISEIKLNYLDYNFNQNSFEDDARNLALVLWLKYNNTYFEITKSNMIEKDVLEESKIFFSDNFLVSHDFPSYIESSYDVKTMKIGNYFITQTK